MADVVHPWSRAELRLMVIVQKHTPGAPPGVDWDAVAEEYGYANRTLARSKYMTAKAKCKPAGEVKNKAADDLQTPQKKGKRAAPDSDPVPPKRPRKSAVKKSDFPEYNESDEDEQLEKRPKIEAKAKGMSESPKVKLEPVDEDEGTADQYMA